MDVWNLSCNTWIELRMTTPRVTVLIDTYNHERFIEEAIVSVLEQDFPSGEMEILVVDDGSTDRTPEIVRKFQPRVRLLRKKNGGQASAFNAGIPEAQGEIVAFLDGDDWWAPNKLIRVMQAMSADPAVGIVGHGIVMVFLDGHSQSEILREGFRIQANTIEGARLFCRRGSFLGTSRMTIRAGLLRRIGPIPDAIAVQADEYLFTLASALAGLRILSEPLTYYRLHDANAFQFSVYDPARMRHKQKALAVLAHSLAEQLERHGIDPQVRRLIAGRAQADADQLRLMLDGGWPWETVATEWKIYRVTHPEAPLSHRAFKLLILLAALATPPRSFYSVQRKLAQSGLYRRARKRWLPVPGMPHIQRDWRTDR
jgi:glycosyltransferase involved in cell wall biosynthesis